MKKLPALAATAALALSASAEFYNDVKVPMRDGVNLAADVYVPTNRPAEKLGCRLYFTPYNSTKRDVPGAADYAEKAGVVDVWADCRGLCHSEGVFEPWDPKFHEDAYDLLEWISKQPWSNGRVVMWGGSYCAATQLACQRSGHPALVGCAPSVVTYDPYRIVYANGVLAPIFQRGWHSKLAGTNSWEEQTRHPDHEDPYWVARRQLNDLHRSKGAAFYQAGWFDMLGIDTFNTFRDMPEGSFLRIGPWSHGVNTFDKPDIDYSSKAGRGGSVTEDLELDFLDSALAGREPKTAKFPGRILMYVMGRNEWRFENEWPLRRAVARKLYFAADGRLVLDSPEAAAGEDSFVYDPSNPVPSKGSRIIHGGGQYDMTEIEKHPGVKSYTSDVLAEDLEVTGEVLASFLAKSTAAEADIAVKLVDVWPDGRPYNVMDSIARGRFAKGGTTKLDFLVDITSYVFLKGHRIRVDLAGSNSPHYEKAKDAAETSFVRGGADGAFLTLPTVPSGSIVLAPLFQDGCILPAGKPFAITGRTLFNSPVRITLLGHTYEGKSDENGCFSVEIAALPVTREPFEIVVADRATSFAIRDCRVGLLLLAGGQSNMEVRIDETADWKAEVAKADRPLIREFKVPHEIAFHAQTECGGRWTSVTPATAAKIGAVGYFTAEYLQDALGGIPVGIVNNSWSATPIQPWMNLDYFLKDKRFAKSGCVKDFYRWRHLGRDGVDRYREQLGATLFLADTGNEGLAKGWNNGPQADWKDIAIPGWLETLYGDTADGAFWFAREVEIPAALAGRDLEFRASTIDDYDITYFNGVEIGRTGEETPDSWNVPRAYRVPGSLVKAGRNVISIRCFDSAHAGGLGGEKVQLAAADGTVIDLRGTWKIKDERIIPAKKWPADYLPLVKIYRTAAILRNAMVLPFKGIPFDAILWYQGESNAGSRTYGEMFRELIADWRSMFGGEQVPFVFVQLAAFTAPPKDAADSGDWPVTRAEQESALALPNVRMTPAIDIGDAGRIHPLNKREVGRRNALWLLQDFLAKDRYAGKIAFPALRSVSAENGAYRLAFDGADGLRTVDGKAPACFSVEGPAVKRGRPKCAWAAAEIRGSEIVVTPPADFGEVAAVRYAWHMNPQVNTVNALGFPMLPFRAPAH